MSRFENGVVVSFSDPGVADREELIFACRLQNWGCGHAFALRGESGDGLAGRYWCVGVAGLAKVGQAVASIIACRV